jgi:hypothetical protein
MEWVNLVRCAEAVSAVRFLRLEIVGMGVLLLSAAGCTTTLIESATPPPPKPPEWTSVPHPVGLDLGDIDAIFTVSDGGTVKSPTRLELVDCDRPVRVLREKTLSKEELALGIRELVRTDPVGQHWCFYGKILTLEEQVKDPALLIRGRQEAVLSAYSYLAPVAKAFHVELNDSRYWRCAIQRYRLLSERVFFQKVEPTPETTSTLVTASNPFAWVRPGGDSDAGILKKYGIALPSAVAPPVTPTPVNEPIVPPMPEDVGSSDASGEVIPPPVTPDSKLVPELEALPEAPPFDESSVDGLEKP